MADFNALEALINAHIKKNGVQAITGNILNGILRGMVAALGKGYTIAGSASPATDPGTMTGPLAYIAYTAGTYTHFGGLEVEQGEVAMLIYNEAEWHKEVLFSLAASATIDGNVGTPEVGVSFVDGQLTFDFRNMKGNPGDPAGFGTVNATVDDQIGTPSVSVQSSGPDTAKNFTFAFHNLKGETGVTSVVATVDNTSGTPSCAVSLQGQQLTLAFTGLKGAQGNTGVSADYPIAIINNLTTDDPASALSAAQGVVLDGKVSQLEAKVVGNLMSSRAKNAILAVFDKVAFAVPDVSAEMTELENALFNLDEVTGINAVYTQGSTVIWSDGVSVLNDLKANLVVNAEYGDGTEVAVNNYILSGTLTTGTSVITVEYEGFTTTFNVTVTEYGSKMSYSMAEGTMFYRAGQVSTYTHNGLTCLGIQNWGNTNTRRVFPINFGNQKMHDNTGSTLLDAYPIKIPYGAKTVTCNISGDTQQIGCRVLYRLEDGHFCNGGAEGYPSVTTPSYGTGTNSLDISSISTRSDAYLFVWGQRVSSATYVGHEPTAISVIFSNE